MCLCPVQKINKYKIMKNLLTFCISVSLLLFGGLACKNNPFAKHTKQYNCTIAGDPEPKTSEDYLNRAKKHIEIFSEGRVTSLDNCALAALNEAIRLDPNNANAFRVRGFGFGQNKQFEQALADYGKAIEIEPGNPISYYLRNKIYLEKEMFEKALADISEAIRLKPDDENYYYDRGFIYRKLGKNDLSEADEQKHRELISVKTEKNTNFRAK